MNNLANKAFLGLFQLILIIGVLLFVPARSLRYWQAWIFLLVFAMSVFIITLYFCEKIRNCWRAAHKRDRSQSSKEARRSFNRWRAFSSFCHFSSPALTIALAGPQFPFPWSFSVMYW